MRNKIEYGLLISIECSDPLHNIDQRLECVPLRWSADDKMDHM